MSTITSYAQAARGQAAGQPSPQLTSSSAPSITGSQTKDDVSNTNSSVTAPSITSNVTEARDAELGLQSEAVNGLSKLDNENHEQADSASLSAVAQGDKPGQDRETKIRSSQRQAAEKGSRSASRTSRANDGTEGKKGRKGKKRAEKDSQNEQPQDENVEKEKEKEPVKPVVLTEAAIPVVNPWTKRAEVLQSKTKVASPSASSPDAVQENKSQEPSEASNVQPLANGINGDKSTPKKSIEAPRAADAAPRRVGPRGARANDKEEKNSASLPSVADSASWPDPKSAALKEQQQSTRKPQGKTETTDKDVQEEVGSTRKKTWEKLEINHSVVFETQLPTPRGSKPRGGARGGRESGSMRGNLNGLSAATSPTTVPSNEKTGPSAGPSGPKTAAARPRDTTLPTRPATQTQAPAPSKRASVDNTPREQRKPSVSGVQDQSREVTSENPAPSRKGAFTKDIRTENGPLSSEGAQSFSRAGHQERTNGVHGHVNGHGFQGREARAERGRGSYRGRGGHNGASGAHAGPSQFAGNGYNASQGTFQGRQNASAQSPPPFNNQFSQSYGHSARGRGKWAGQHGRNSSGNPSGFAPRAAPLTSDYPVAAAMYAPFVAAQQQQQQQQQQDYWTLINVVKNQVEYYFSLDNLVKDTYLRKFMDGSGFVPLSVISNFKRINSLSLTDPEILRTGCMLSDAVEMVRGEDQIERVRSLKVVDLAKLLLPEHLRVEEARNNGPASFEVLKLSMMYPAVPYGTYYDEQAYNSQTGFVNGGYFSSAVNGGLVNGHQYGHESQLSAVVPEFSPSEAPATLESMTNLSDSQVDRLILILDSDEAAGVVGFLSADSEQETKSINEEVSAESVVWFDANKSGPPASNNGRQSYSEVRKAALDQRQKAQPSETPKDMQRLYQFWSQMLPNKFNAKMYEEFRSLALEDARREVPNSGGLTSLRNFYATLLLGDAARPWTSIPLVLRQHSEEASQIQI